MSSVPRFIHGPSDYAQRLFHRHTASPKACGSPVQPIVCSLPLICPSLIPVGIDRKQVQVIGVLRRRPKIGACEVRQSSTMIAGVGLALFPSSCPPHRPALQRQVLQLGRSAAASWAALLDWFCGVRTDEGGTMSCLKFFLEQHRLPRAPDPSLRRAGHRAVGLETQHPQDPINQSNPLECQQEAKKICVLPQGTALITLGVHRLHKLDWQGGRGQGMPVKHDTLSGLAVQCLPLC